MADKKTVFNPDWTDPQINPQWCLWLKNVDKDPFRAQCTVCNKSFHLSNMGRQAITSHEDSKKHIKNLNSLKQTVAPIHAFFKKKMRKLFLNK